MGFNPTVGTISTRRRTAGGQGPALGLPASDEKKWMPVKKELDLAVRLIKEMSEKWQPDNFHDEYRDALMTFIEKKIQSGDTIENVAKPDDDDGKVVEGKVLDLASYLERSLKGGAKAKPKTKEKSAKKPAPAKKHVAKKAPSKKARRSA